MPWIRAVVKQHEESPPRALRRRASLWSGYIPEGIDHRMVNLPYGTMFRA